MSSEYETLDHQLGNQLMNASKLKTEQERINFINETFASIYAAYKGGRVNGNEYVKLINRLALSGRGEYGDYVNILVGAAKIGTVGIVLEGGIPQLTSQADRQEFTERIINTDLSTSAALWEMDRRVGGPISYFIVIVDGEKNIPIEVIHDPETAALQINHYSPADYDYTIHDFCDHENDECVAETEEYQAQEAMDMKMFSAANMLRLAANQIKQTQIAARIIEKKRDKNE